MKHRIFICAMLTSSVSVALRAQRAIPLERFCVLSENTSQKLRAYNDSVSFSDAPGQIVGQMLMRSGHPALNGYVRVLENLSDQKPIREVRADTLGVFRITGLPPRTYILGFQAFGQQPQWQSVKLLGAGADTMCIRTRWMPRELSPVVPMSKPQALP